MNAEAQTLEQTLVWRSKRQVREKIEAPYVADIIRASADERKLSGEEENMKLRV